MDDIKYTISLGGPFVSLEQAQACFEKMKTFHMMVHAKIDESWISKYDIDHYPAATRKIHIVIDSSYDRYSQTVKDLRLASEFWLYGWREQQRLLDDKAKQDSEQKEKDDEEKQTKAIDRIVKKLMMNEIPVGVFQGWHSLSRYFCCRKLTFEQQRSVLDKMIDAEYIRPGNWNVDWNAKVVEIWVH